MLVLEIRIVVVVALFILAVVVVVAGLEGGSSWSGGSSSYSSGSGTDSDGVVAIFAIVGLIGFVYNIAKEANESDESFSSNSGPKRTTEERAGRPIENNYEAIRRIRKLDPMFDEDRFLSQVKLVYLQLQSAWTEKDWNSVRNLESTSLYEQHLTQLQEHIRAKNNQCSRARYVWKIRRSKTLSKIQKAMTALKSFCHRR